MATRATLSYVMIAARPVVSLAGCDFVRGSRLRMAALTDAAANTIGIII